MADGQSHRQQDRWIRNYSIYTLGEKDDRTVTQTQQDRLKDRQNCR